MLLFMGICRKCIPRCESCGTLETTGHVSDDLLKRSSMMIKCTSFVLHIHETSIYKYYWLQFTKEVRQLRKKEQHRKFLWQRFHKVQLCWLQPQRSRPDIFTNDNKPEVCFRKMETARVTVAQYHETDEAKHECLEQLSCRGRQWSW